MNPAYAYSLGHYGSNQESANQAAYGLMPQAMSQPLQHAGFAMLPMPMQGGIPVFPTQPFHGIAGLQNTATSDLADRLGEQLMLGDHSQLHAYRGPLAGVSQTSLGSAHDVFYTAQQTRPSLTQPIVLGRDLHTRGLSVPGPGQHLTPGPTSAPARVQQSAQQPKRRNQRGMEDNIKRTIYVSYIDLQVTEEQLATFFSECGCVVDCRICGDANSAMRFAFLEFADLDTAQRALSKNGTMLGGSPLRVLPSKTAILPVSKDLMPRSHDEIERCSRTVYVANIDKKVDRSDVRAFFEQLCGPVAKLRLLGDYAHTTRIAFIEFVHAEGAMAALNCSGALLGSLPIRVSPSKTPVRSETGSKTGNRSGPNSGGSGNKVDLSGGLHTPSQSAPSSGNLGGAPGLSPEDLITLHAGPASTPIPATGQLPGSSQAAPSNSLQAADDTLAAEPASNPAGGAMASPRTAAAGAEDVPQLAEVPQGESVDDGTA